KRGLADEVPPERPERERQRGLHRAPRARQRGHRARAVTAHATPGGTVMHPSSRGFQTEIEFTLPKGYLDATGILHRRGVMRLATAADEILPLRDPRVQQNQAYLAIIVLARVITKLGDLPAI